MRMVLAESVTRGNVRSLEHDRTHPFARLFDSVQSWSLRCSHRVRCLQSRRDPHGLCQWRSKKGPPWRRPCRGATVSAWPLPAAVPGAKRRPGDDRDVRRAALAEHSAYRPERIDSGFGSSPHFGEPHRAAGIAARSRGPGLHGLKCRLPLFVGQGSKYNDG